MEATNQEQNLVVSPAEKDRVSAEAELVRTTVGHFDQARRIIGRAREKLKGLTSIWSSKEQAYQPEGLQAETRGEEFYLHIYEQRKDLPTRGVGAGPKDTLMLTGPEVVDYRDYQDEGNERLDSIILNHATNHSRHNADISGYMHFDKAGMPVISREPREFSESQMLAARRFLIDLRDNHDFDISHGNDLQQHALLVRFFDGEIDPSDEKSVQRALVEIAEKKLRETHRGMNPKTINQIKKAPNIETIQRRTRDEKSKTARQNERSTEVSQLSEEDVKPVAADKMIAITTHASPGLLDIDETPVIPEGVEHTDQLVIKFYEKVDVSKESLEGMEDAEDEVDSGGNRKITYQDSSGNIPADTIQSLCPEDEDVSVLIRGGNLAGCMGRTVDGVIRQGQAAEKKRVDIHIPLWEVYDGGNFSRNQVPDKLAARQQVDYVVVDNGQPKKARVEGRGTQVNIYYWRDEESFLASMKGKED